LFFFFLFVLQTKPKDDFVGGTVYVGSGDLKKQLSSNDLPPVLDLTTLMEKGF